MQPALDFRLKAGATRASDSHALKAENATGGRLPAETRKPQERVAEECEAMPRAAAQGDSL